MMAKKSNFTLTFDDKEIRRKLAQVETAVRVEATKKGLHALALFLIGHIKVNIVNRKLVDTGNLLGSVQEDELVVFSDGGYVMFGPHTVYAAIHEFGGVILPTNGPYLVFKGKDGNWVMTKSVHMPARPYIRPALDEHGKEALDFMGSTIGSIIEGSWSK